ncbi:hypothetical protein ABKW28_19245 [Nocardioides sp. 31GB23]|uniref:hypothetical protein n=1 Tax=Nocardioides sp. 31GB23 TaxID=3156065 RepID=UPI0032AFDC96
MTNRLQLRSRTETADMSPDAQQDSADVTFKVYAMTRTGPEPIVRVGSSLLRDGAIEIVDGYSNRDITLVVGLDGTHSTHLADGEAAIWRVIEQIRTDRYGELAWTPPDQKGPTSIYTVLWGQMDPVDDDTWDIRELQGKRTFALKLRCKPFARSAERDVVTTATEYDPTVATLMDGTDPDFFIEPGSSDDRTAITDAGRTVVEVVGGWVQSGGYGSPIFQGGAAAKFNVPTGVGAFAVTYRNVGNHGFTQTHINDKFVVRDITEYLDGGYVREIYDVSDLSGPIVVRITLTVDDNFYDQTPSYDPTLRFDEIVTMAVLPAIGGKATMRALPIKGSARAPGTITISHAATALGDVLALTAPNMDSGYTPDLRRRRVAGGSTGGDNNAIGGRRENLNGTNPKFTVPFSLYPDGTYALIARMKLTASRLVTLRANHEAVTYREVSTYASATPNSGDDWGWVVLGTMRLPARAASRAVTGTFDFVLDVTSAGPSDYLDDIFVIPVDAALTLAHGLTTRRLSLVAPDLDLPRGAVWMHDQADESDAFSALAQLESNDDHELHAGRTLCYVAASGPATPVVVGASYYPHDHTNVTR